MRNLLWILCLSFLSVGARNFEDGLSIDGPLYASIARNVARGGDAFSLSVGLPEYPVYADHPHFGFWLHALWFKIFPATDWAARIPSHLMYVAFLWLLAAVITRLHSKRTAVLTVLLLWIWSPFANYFSNLYLDPGALLFGFAFLVALKLAFDGRWFWSPLAGLMLALSFGYKGLTALAFGPVAAMLSVEALRQDLQRKRASASFKIGLCLAVTTIVLGLYYLAVRQSSVPDFFTRYWIKQMTGRFSGSWGLLSLFHANFWQQFFRSTSWVGLLIFPSLWQQRSSRNAFLVPLILFLTVVGMYAPTDRSGGQYTLLLLPWAAWLIAAFLDFWMGRSRKLSRLSANHLIRVSSVIAVALVMVIQYLPLRTHAREAPSELSILQRNPSQFAEIQRLVLDPNDGSHPDFVSASAYLWYLDRPVAYVRPGEPVPRPLRGDAYILRRSTHEKVESLLEQGWCHFQETLYVPCAL